MDKKETGIPDLAWLERVRGSLVSYWEGTPWQVGGDYMVAKLEKAMKEQARHLRELPGNFIPMALDAQLAAAWHATRAKDAIGFGPFDSRRFGAVRWIYRPFVVLEDLGEHRYLCLDDEDDAFHVWSRGLTASLKEGQRCFLSLMIDSAAGWWMSYGPLLGWEGLLRGDLSHLASLVARQLYRNEGFDAVVRANPVPFWAAWKFSGAPMAMHGNEPVLSLWIEGSLEPAFEERLPKTWRREDAGRRSRWLNGKDFLSRKEIYLNRATGEALLLARREGDLPRLRKLVGESFLPRGEAGRCGALMEVIVAELLKEDGIAERWERPFTRG